MRVLVLRQHCSICCFLVTLLKPRLIRASFWQRRLSPWRSDMPHITLPEGLPGITAGFAFRPETAQPMRELAHTLLHTSGQKGDLSSRDRELIATFVSSRNTCYFCQTSHGAAATHLAGGRLRPDRCRLQRLRLGTDLQQAQSAACDRRRCAGRRQARHSGIDRSGPERGGYRSRNSMTPS